MVLACATGVPACFETKVIAADPGEESGGKTTSNGGASNGGGSSGFQSKSCVDCQKSKCETEYAK